MNQHRPLYFDYAATTPLDERIISVMQSCLTFAGDFGNPASSHQFGSQALSRIDEARRLVAAFIKAPPAAVIWTSSATEANNLAIKGIAEFYRFRGNHIVTSTIEHKSILECCRTLETRGFKVTYLKPDNYGKIARADLEQALTPETILLTLAHANSELGVVQDIEAMGQLARSRDIPFHLDCAQSAGKIPLDVSKMPVDLLSLSAHKMYGPKGIGALYLRLKPPLRLQPLLHGGTQERGFRAGTLATHQIVGFGEACRLMQQDWQLLSEDLLALRLQLWAGLKELPDVMLNGSYQDCLPSHLNVCFKNVSPGALSEALKAVASASGSACDSIAAEPSHVLQALGRSKAEIASSRRFSLGRYNTKQDIDELLQRLKTLYPNGGGDNHDHSNK